jgi:phospholipid/cholesterol/gamma-HCH transport system ATP-binding protein
VSAAMKKSQESSAVIDIRALHTRYGKAVVHENVSLTVQPGEIFSLVGGSGCGKSTLLRAIICCCNGSSSGLARKSSA